MKSLGFLLVLEGQIKVDKAHLVLPQFLVRVGEDGCRILAVSWGEHLLEVTHETMEWQ